MWSNVGYTLFTALSAVAHKWRSSNVLAHGHTAEQRRLDETIAAAGPATERLDRAIVDAAPCEVQESALARS
jgi:hypothetical protein